MRLVITFLLIAFSLNTMNAQTLPLLKEGTRVSIPLNKNNTKGLDIFIKSMTYQDSTSAKQQQQAAVDNLNKAMSTLSNVIDGREDDFFDEEIDEVE